MPLDSSTTAIAAFTDRENMIYIWSLVLSAADIDHIIMKDESGWFIRVPPQMAEMARLEITTYEEENLNWPAASVDGTTDTADISIDTPPTVLMMGGLIIFYTITGPWLEGNLWFRLGAVAAEKILANGEWWRLITGLTLHSGPVHLLSNVLIGALLVHFLCRNLGSGLGWLLILLTGAAGNYLNILFRSTNHHSVGFSTAVFGTIGLLAGYQTIRKRRMAVKDMLLPLAGGAGLLAFLGSAGENTDLGAHFFGLLAGIIIGSSTAALPDRHSWIASKSLQSTLFLLCILLLITSWLLAWG